MINRRRVVETYDPSVDRRGSGFLLSPSLVLTAAHCVPSGPGAKVAVRAERDTTFREDGTVRWTGRGKCDVALIELAETHRYSHVNPVPFGRPVGLVNWQAVGFPWAQERPGSAKPRTAAESASGRLDPLTGMRAGTYDVEITSGVPESRGPGLSPWGGMSGAAVFAEGALIAVLAEDPDRFGPGRLRAVPITRMLEESESTGLVAPDSEPEVEAVWAGHREVLARPYETLPSPPSPLLLLQYQYAALPFHPARADDLVALESWCEDDASIAVALVEGVGGTGKTRLAAELCRVVRQRRWVAGFLIGLVNPARLTTLSRLAEPRLVVIDAAETRANDVLELARAMSSQPQQAPVRVLLLARSIAPGSREAAGWWRGLQTMRNPLQAAFLTAEHRTLTPLPTGHAHIDERRSIFRGARELFATLLRVPDSTAEPDDLAGPTYDTFLFLQIGALVALTAPSKLSASEAALLSAVLDTERELIWRPTAQAQGVSSAGGGPTDVELDVALAVATLAVADSRDNAVALLEKIPDVAASGPVTRVADWLQTLYPGDGWLRPIRPDRLGEHHAGRVVVDHPSLPKLLLRHAAALLAAHGLQTTSEPPRLAGRTLTVLARAAMRNDDQASDVRLSLEAALSAPSVDGEPFLRYLVDLALQNQDNGAAVAPLATGLTAALAAARVPAAAAAAMQGLESRLVRSLFVLEDLVDALSLQRLSHARELAARDPSRRLELFEALLGARTALMHAFRYAQSTDVAREALALARQLHSEDTSLHAVTLARALEVAAVSDHGAEDAIGYAQDAVALRRQLSNGDPQELRYVAANYDKLAWALSAKGLHQDAAQAVQQEIAVLEALSGARPNDPFRPAEIFYARTALAHHLAKAGRAEEAIRIARASVQEAGRAPSEIRQSHIAYAYGVLTRVLGYVGRSAEAIEPATEQVRIYRALESESPDQYLDLLTGAYNQLSNAATGAGRHEDAVKAAREVVALQRPMAEASPTRHRPHLALMLGNLSNALLASGRGDEAVAAAQESVDILEDLAAKGEGEHLALMLGKLSDALLASGRGDEAVAAAQEGVDILEDLAAKGERHAQAIEYVRQTLRKGLESVASPGGDRS